MPTSIRGVIRWNPPRLLLALILVLVVLASGYGISQVRASHADPNEVHLCVNTYTGQVRHVLNPSQCTNSSYLVTVNQQGVEGPQGPDGPPGNEGPPGPQGPAGPSSTVIRETIDSEIAPGTSHETMATCADGEVATGGGYFSTSINTVYPRSIGPVGADGSQPTEWRAIWVNNTAEDGIGGVRVVCAQP